MTISNRTLFVGDNLPCLRGMDAGTVDLIVTDPPFCKARDFHSVPGSQAAGIVFQDRWVWDDIVDSERVRAMTIGGWHGVAELIACARQIHPGGLAAYLCFMAVRLIEMRRVLKATGTVYLHCDLSASHYLKVLMDAIFGEANFRNEIVWGYGLGGSSRRYFSRKHDILLFYTKSGSYHFDKPRVPATSVRMRGQTKGMTTVWTDIPSLNNMSAERTGWPTQKPLALYERLILASSRPAEVVLDPFCGSATTCVAAERLGRQWVGMELLPVAGELLARRLKDVAGPTGKRAGRVRLVKAKAQPR